MRGEVGEREGGEMKQTQEGKRESQLLLLDSTGTGKLRRETGSGDFVVACIGGRSPGGGGGGGGGGFPDPLSAKRSSIKTKNYTSCNIG